MPAVLLTGAGLALTFGMLQVFEHPVARAADRPEPAPTATPAVQIAARSSATGLSRAMNDLVPADATWAARIPSAFGCQAPDTVASATWTRGRVTYGIHALPTGAARAAIDELARCGQQTDVDGAPGAIQVAGAGRVTIWQRGDLLVSVVAARTPSSEISALDARVQEVLGQTECLALSMTPADVNRRPQAPGHEQYTVERTVLPPADEDLEAPAIDDIDLPEPLALEDRTMPEGIVGPAIESDLDMPVAPTGPGPIPDTRVVRVPAPDTLGPGCGWVWSGVLAPASDAGAIQIQADKALERGGLDLADARRTWVKAAETFIRDADTFRASVETWDAHVARAQAAHALWDSQVEALAAYATDLETYRTALDARQTFLDEQDAARTAYDDAVTACAAEPVDPADAEPSIAPGTEPTPSPACPPERPAVLDEQAPPAPALPDAPELWAPGDPW